MKVILISVGVVNIIMPVGHGLLRKWRAEVAKPEPLPGPMPVSVPDPEHDTKYNWRCRKLKG